MRITTTILFVALAATASAQSPDYKYGSREWKRIARKATPELLRSEEGHRLAGCVMAWQRVTGGWPKNQAIHQPLTDSLRQKLAADRTRRDDSTTDNDATITEMDFLARYCHAVPADTAAARALGRAVAYLLDGQYDNGGWPQFWPVNRGDYQTHITYNDNAMVQTLQILRAVSEGREPYGGLLPDSLTRRAARAFSRGISCILRTQIVKDGVPTVWCQQHDRHTLLPAAARSYELPSYCTQESVAIVRLLMELPEPSDSVRRAVNGAMLWLDAHKLTGLRLSREGGDTHLVSDPSAPPLWARFYDLDDALPYVCDRDGIPRRSLEEIGSERRNGYSWYNTAPAALYPLYEKWKKRAQ